MEQSKLTVLQIQKFELVIYLQCPRDIAKQRFVDRKLPGRLHQDDVTMFNKRFDEHEEKSLAVVQHYDSIGILVNVRLIAVAQLQWLTFTG